MAEKEALHHKQKVQETKEEVDVNKIFYEPNVSQLSGTSTNSVLTKKCSVKKEGTSTHVKTVKKGVVTKLYRKGSLSKHSNSNSCSPKDKVHLSVLLNKNVTDKSSESGTSNANAGKETTYKKK